MIDFDSFKVGETIISLRGRTYRVSHIYKGDEKEFDFAVLNRWCSEGKRYVYRRKPLGYGWYRRAN